MKKILTILLFICLILINSGFTSARNYSFHNMEDEEETGSEIDNSTYIDSSPYVKIYNYKISTNVLIGDEGEYIYKIYTEVLEDLKLYDSELKDIEIKTDIKFESSDSSILEVTDKGKWKALKEGKVKINYSANYSEETINAFKEKRPDLVFVDYKGKDELAVDDSIYSFPEEGEIEINVYSGIKNVYRLYNKNNGDHLYTIKSGERDKLISLGWVDEKIACEVPDKSDQPVYRLYNQKKSVHHFTIKEGEKNKLTKNGWKYEGIAFYSANKYGDPVYRKYNKNSKNGIHLFTKNDTEYNNTKLSGWKSEGKGWNCMVDPVRNADTRYQMAYYYKGEEVWLLFEKWGLCSLTFDDSFDSSNIDLETGDMVLVCLRNRYSDVVNLGYPKDDITVDLKVVSKTGKLPKWALHEISINDSLEYDKSLFWQ